SLLPGCSRVAYLVHRPQSGRPCRRTQPGRARRHEKGRPPVPYGQRARRGLVAYPARRVGHLPHPIPPSPSRITVGPLPTREGAYFFVPRGTRCRGPPPSSRGSRGERIGPPTK